MSARSKRSNTNTPVQQSTTPRAGGGGSAGTRSTSPYSPTRSSRIQEKTELQNLNDRLACYIDRVRNLENENSRLIVEVQTSRETVTREISNIKSMYDVELSGARQLLDETAREKAKLEIDATSLWEEIKDLKARLDKKTKDLAIAENNAKSYELSYMDVNSKYTTACKERNKALDDLKDLEKEADKLRKQLAQARKLLEAETLARVDLENNVQSLKEELSFKDDLHSQELVDTRTKRQVEISEIDGRLCEEYEAKLQKSLQELRDQYEAQIRINRDEVEAMYENKIKFLEDSAARNSNNSSVIMEELRQTRMHLDGFKSQISQLEAANASLLASKRDLERTLESERAFHASERAQLEAELLRLRDEMANQLQEYKDLMDTKVSLDLELAAYDKLLKGEEHRLNITSPAGSGGQTISQASISTSQRGSTSGRRTPLAGYRVSVPKRKRTFVEETMDRHQSDFSVSSSAKGDIEISDQDPEGKFIKLFNKGNKEISIGGWQIIRKAGANETTFKFHRSVKIDSQSHVTVWSSDVGTAHEPPANIVMKSQKWMTADNVQTKLLNSSGEETATSECIKNIISSHESRHRDSTLGSGSTSFQMEQIYHQRGDPNSVDSKGEKCFIM